MRTPYIIFIAFFVGILFAFIDLLGTLTPVYPNLAQWLYYIGLDLLVGTVAFLLVHDLRIEWYLTALLFGSAFFSIQVLWNVFYATIAWFTGTLHFPINLGLGWIVDASEYYIALLFQLIGAFILYLAQQTLRSYLRTRIR